MIASHNFGSKWAKRAEIEHLSFYKPSFEKSTLDSDSVRCTEQTNSVASKLAQKENTLKTSSTIEQGSYEEILVKNCTYKS